jgi:hypothetical protein
MDKVKYKTELENNFANKQKDLKTMEDSLQNEKINFERALLVKYQKWQENDNQNIKDQVKFLLEVTHFIRCTESKNTNLLYEPNSTPSSKNIRPGSNLK